MQFYETTDFELQSGKVVPQARLGYCVYGKSSRPVIALHPAVSGSPKALTTAPEGYGEGWFNRHIGPGKFLDTDRYQVVCFGHFGGNGPSSSAQELAPFHNDLSIVDTCRLAALALKENGVETIHASMGASMGVAIARHWLFQEHVKVQHVIEIFGNYGNNYYGSVANSAHRIHYDVLMSDGSNIHDIRKRYVQCFEPLCNEARAFRTVYLYVLKLLDELMTNPEEMRRVVVARLIAYFRFVSPLYFQRKWDRFFLETYDYQHADQKLYGLLDHVGKSFAKDFKSFSVATLRLMDAAPQPIPPEELISALRRHDARLMGVIVRGDRIYDSHLQFDDYMAVYEALPSDEKELFRLHICHNEVRGHDHFLDPQFDKDAQVIIDFWEERGRRNLEGKVRRAG
ncbi:hypothetical protein B5K11_25625 [Rhizobium leguminosarum bv. trifolii]|nr:hypothetical protein B5K11_25625 [Rhizobium leguminosarum bv. trifolii]